MKRKILFIDDMTILLDLYKTQIERKFPQIEVMTANNVVDAMAQLAMEVDGEELIAVVSDYDIGLVDGVQVARKVRKNFPLLPIFVHTQSADEDINELEAKCEGIQVSVLSKSNSMKAYIMPWLEEELKRDVSERLIFVATLIN